MANKELSKRLSERSHLSEADAERCIQFFVEVLKEYFKKGEKVIIAEFGSFSVTDDGLIQFNPSAKLKSLVGE